jgi:hypothetical protein
MVPVIQPEPILVWRTDDRKVQFSGRKVLREGTFDRNFDSYIPSRTEKGLENED